LDAQPELLALAATGLVLLVVALASWSVIDTAAPQA